MATEVVRLGFQEGGTIVRHGVTYMLVPAPGRHSKYVPGVFRVSHGAEIFGTVGLYGWATVHVVSDGMEVRTALMQKLAAAWSGKQAVLTWLIDKCPKIAAPLRATRTHVQDVSERGDAFELFFDDASAAAAFEDLWEPVTPRLLETPSVLAIGDVWTSGADLLWVRGVRSVLHIRKDVGGPGSMLLPPVQRPEH